MKWSALAIAALCLLGTVPQAHATGDIIPCYRPALSPSTDCTEVSTTAPLPVAVFPSAAATAGITPVVSASAENNHVLKASAGNLYSVSATNLTATAGFLVILNLTASPADGAILPLAFAPLPANGFASISYGGQPPAVYSTGIVAVITSAATPFTKTTGVITAAISGSVQ